MKNLIATLALTVMIAFTAGCQTNFPKPTNANGTTNVSVGVDEAMGVYAITMHTLNKYLATCRANMATKGCSKTVMDQIVAASDKAFDAIVKAQNATKNLPQGDTGLQLALDDMNAALVFLEAIKTP